MIIEHNRKRTEGNPSGLPPHNDGSTMNNITKLTFAFSVVAVFLFASTARSAATDFFTVQEYVALHPEEANKMKAFSTIISEPGKPSQVRHYKPIQIAVVYPGIQASDYWRRSLLSFKKRMDEIGIAYEINEYFTKPSSQTRAQSQHIRTALASNPDYLVFTMDVGTHRRIIEKILTKERPKLILQNITTPVRAWEGRQPFLYVGFDHEIGTKILAGHFLDKHGRSGRYAMLYFSRGYVSSMRGDTFIQFMSNNSEWELAGAYYTDGERTKARQATLDILANGPVDFIYACSTDTALGGVDALKEAGKIGTIPINGWGGGSSELRAILDGELDVTVMRNNDDNGVAMAEAIRLDMEGREKEVPTIFSGSFFLVEKGINKERLDKLVDEAFRYSGRMELQ